MRICVIGGGISGTLLAMRLAERPEVEVLLVTTSAVRQDATSVSAGLVRGFEPDPFNATLARDSLAELYANTELRSMASYRETGSVYLPRRAPGPEALFALESRLPGSTSLLDAGELAERFGVTGVPADAVAVLERRSGHIDPDQLRRQLLARLSALGAEVVRGSLGRLCPPPGPDHSTSFEVEDRSLAADAVVLAAGAWTAGLLAAIGLPHDSLATKVIQYAVYEVSGERPPAFVDEHSGLYGRPVGPRRMLLGLPTDRWIADVKNPGCQFSTTEERRVRELAEHMLPRLNLLRIARTAAAMDGYTPDGRLCLRAAAPGLFTFTGGSGGGAKTALAAANIAAGQLLDVQAPLPAEPLGRRDSA